MAADTFKIKRGTTAQVNAYLPAVGEPVMDVTLNQLHIGDGVTLGGVLVGTLTTAFMASLLDDPTAADALLTLGAAPLASPTFTGVPAGPTAAPGANSTQLATTAFVEAARVILAAEDALKAPLASPVLTGTPTAPTAAVGTNTTQLATTAMLQAEIANKRTWTSYTPTVTAATGTFTAASATGKSMVAFGICHVQINITITTKGTGADPKATLPFTALSGSSGHVMPCREELVNGLSGSAIILAALDQVQVTTSTNSNMATADGCVIHISGSFPVA